MFMYNYVCNNDAEYLFSLDMFDDYVLLLVYVIFGNGNGSKVLNNVNG